MEQTVLVKCLDGMLVIPASDAALIWTGDKTERNYVGSQLDFRRELISIKELTNYYG